MLVFLSFWQIQAVLVNFSEGVRKDSKDNLEIFLWIENDDARLNMLCTSACTFKLLEKHPIHSTLPSARQAFVLVCHPL